MIFTESRTTAYKHTNVHQMQVTSSLSTNVSGADIMRCDLEEMSRTIHSPNASAQIFLTVSCVAVFIGTRTLFNTIRRGLAQITVVVIGAGPVGLTSALIAVRDYKRVTKLILYEEQSKYNVEHRPYQISIQPSVVAFLNKNGIDFDNLEGIWHEGCFYTRVGIYLEYIISILPLYKTDIELRFNTKVRNLQ